MGFFNRKAKKPSPNTAADQQRHIEITVEKEASQEMFDKTKRATKDLNDVLQENHIHIKIYSAVGGKKPKGV